MRKLLRLHLAKVLLIAAMVTGANSWGQILATQAGGGSLPNGWVGTNNVTAQAIDQGSYWLVDAGSNKDYITTSNYDLSGYSSITVGVDVASYGSGTYNSLLIEYSTNGGTSWSTTTYNSVVTTGTTYLSSSVQITQTFSATTKLRFSTSSTSGRGVRIRNLGITGVLSGPTITTTATSFGPFCANTSNNITLPYTSTGTFSGGSFAVQRSAAGGTFADATSNMLATVSSTGTSVTATLPSGLTAGNYRVRIVYTSPTPVVSSTNNGSNIVLTASVAQAATTNAATPVGAVTATLNGSVTAAVCPANSIEKGFVYSVTATNANPQVGGTGVTKTQVGNSTITTGAYTLGLTSLTPGTQYSYAAYVYDGTSYAYGAATTFTTSNPQANLSGTLNEGTLTTSNTFTITLAGELFVETPTFTGTGFILGNAPAGVSIASVTRVDDTHATVTLAYDNSDFDTNASINVTIPASHITASEPLVSGNLTITAVVETISSSGTLAFGNQCINTTPTSSFTITGTTKAVAINLAATTYFKYSLTTEGPYTPTLSFTAPAGALSRVIYVQFTPNAVQAYSEAIAISGGAATGFNKTVTGSGINTAPTVASTPTSASVMATTAVLGGNITSIGCSNATVRGIEYSLTNNFANGSGTQVSESGSFGTGSFTVNVGSLTPSTQYFYKAFATNNGGTVYSSQGTFTTQCATPVNVTGLSVASPSPASGQLKADWTNSSCSDQVIVVAKLGSAVTATPSGDGTSYTANAAFGSGTAIATGEYVVYKGSAATVTVTGLTNGSTYHFTVFTRKGTTWSSGVATSGIPVVSYCTPTYSSGGAGDYIANVTLENLTQATASNSSPYYINYTATQTVVPQLGKGLTYTLSLTVGSDSNQYNGVWVDFNNDGNFSSDEFFTSNTNAGANGTVNIQIAVPVNAATGEVRMRIRAGDDNQPLATQSCGASASAWGQAQDYKVNIYVNTAPVLTTTAISSLASTSASTGGNISSDNGFAVTARGVVYSTSANPTIATGTVVNSGSGSGSFTTALTGLQDNKTYYVRAFATNSGGTGYGAQVQFTTLSMTAPVVASASAIATQSFVANWPSVTGAQSYRLDVSTSSTFGNLASEQLNEGFSSVPTTYTTGSVTLPSGSWQITDVLRFTNPNGTSQTGAQLKGDTGILTSPQLNLITSLIVNARRGGTSSSLSIYEVVNGVDNLLQTINLSDDNFTDYPITITQTSPSSRIKIVNNGPFAYVNNVIINYYSGQSSFVTGYNSLTVNGTSQVVSGLTQNTQYYYRVRAVGVNSTSANSGTEPVKTGRENIWTSTGWSAGVAPTVIDKATINYDYNTGTDGEITALELEVLNGTLTIEEGDNVTITKQITINNTTHVVAQGEQATYGAPVGETVIVGPKIVVENNAGLIQVDDTNNTGFIKVDRKSAPMFRLDYALWSSPVAGETLIGFSPKTLTNRFYKYNPLTDAYNNSMTSQGTITFAEGESYLIRVANNHPAYVDETSIAERWEGSYVGTPFNGDVNVAVTPRNPGTYSGFNAVGNPYPSPIKVSEFFARNSGNLVNGSPIFLWRKKNETGTSSYVQLTMAGLNVPNDNNNGDTSDGEYATVAENGEWVLNVGQGFIVQAQSGSVVFDNEMRFGKNHDFQFRTAQDETVTSSRLWLSLKNTLGESSPAMIAYTANTTTGLDYGWDGKAMTDGPVTLYSVVEDNKLGIQARASFEDTDEVPMSYEATAAGTYTITLDQFDGVFTQGQDIFLRDNLLGTTHDLKGGAYEFTSEAGTINGRFDVIYAQPLGTGNPAWSTAGVMVYKDGGNINISTGVTDMTSVKVYDTRGRMLYSGDNINATETVISGLQAEKQVLIVTIATQKGEVSKKIIF